MTPLYQRYCVLTPKDLTPLGLRFHRKLATKSFRRLISNATERRGRVHISKLASMTLKQQPIAGQGLDTSPPKTSVHVSGWQY